jgi:ceramide glucosyltransferase
MITLDQVFRGTVEFCLAGAVFGCLYMALACVLTLRFGQHRREGTRAGHDKVPPPVTLLIPLCGHEPGLASRLRAVCAQAYPAPVQVLCGVSDPGDPAIAVVRALAVELPPGTIDLHLDGRLHGRNLKMSNLMNMMEHARHDVLVMIDSDIEVDSNYLTRVVDELHDPDVGVVTCLYTGVAEGGVWAQLSAMGINLQFLPSAIVAITLGLARPCFGATIAIRRKTLREIGGLGRFADQLWDDYAIGEAVRAAGYQVAVPALALGHVCADASATELHARQLRYARTIGNIEPLGHAGAVITHPFALALLAVPFGGGSTAVVLALVALACRAGLGAAIAYRFGIENRYRLLPLRDLCAFAAYVMSFFGGTVTWRGQRYQVRSDGTLLQPSQ